MTEAIIQFLATIIVGVIGLVGVIFQTKTKVQTEDINYKLDQMKQSHNVDCQKIQAHIDDVEKDSLKRFLTNELSEIRRKKQPRLSEEQKMLIYEAKEKYNKLGGDSYVDDLFDDIKKKDIL